MNYLDAEAQCESDGTYLASPRSNAETAFFAYLIPEESIWISFNDFDIAGEYLSLYGPFFTRWSLTEPKDYVLEVTYWDDALIDQEFKFVCLYRIQQGKPRKTYKYVLEV